MRNWDGRKRGAYMRLKKYAACVENMRLFGPHSPHFWLQSRACANIRKTACICKNRLIIYANTGLTALNVAVPWRRAHLFPISRWRDLSNVNVFWSHKRPNFSRLCNRFCKSDYFSVAYADVSHFRQFFPFACLVLHNVFHVWNRAFFQSAYMWKICQFNRICYLFFKSPICDRKIVQNSWKF